MPLLSSHLFVHQSSLLWISVIAPFSMFRINPGTNFLLHFVRQFHVSMLISTNLSLLHFFHPSLLHSFTLNLKLTFAVNPFRHRSLTIESPDWLSRLIGPCFVSTLLIGFSSWLCVVTILLCLDLLQLINLPLYQIWCKSAPQLLKKYMKYNVLPLLS